MVKKIHHTSSVWLDNSMIVCCRTDMSRPDDLDFI